MRRSLRAGPDGTAVVGTAVNLSGTVSDDGLPTPSSLSLLWTVVSGPGSVAFGNNALASTTAAFSAAGTYVLQLAANDGQLSGSDQVSIVVSPAISNTAPTVNAGPDGTAVVGTSINLNGTVSDDGLPTPSSLSLLWTVVSGPGSVVFGNNTVASTAATFSAAGTYVLQLAAHDGALTGTDQVSIVVSPAVSNTAPIVNAGPDGTAVAGTSINLSGTVSDDGLPTPSSLSLLWTVVSGPGSVVFGNSTLSATTATFNASGTYVLQLAANDGQLTGTDQVSIVVSPANNNPPPVGETPQQMAFQDGLFPNVSYAGTIDTRIASKKSSKNYGDYSYISIDGSPDEAGLFKWDVSAIPAGSVVTSVAIEFNVTDTTSDSYELYALERAWDELSATWQQYANGSSWSGSGASGSADHGSAVLGELAAANTGLYRIDLNDAGVAAVQQWINDPSHNYGIIIQNYNVRKAVIVSTSEANTASERPKLVINYEDPQPVNLPPVVDVGPDLTAQVAQPLTIGANVSDDGQPTGTLLEPVWTKVSGPGTVTFGNDHAVNTTAEFSAAGDYTLRLTVSDSVLSGFDELNVSVS